MARKAYMYHQLALALLFTAVFHGDSCNLEVKEPSEEIWQMEHAPFDIPCDVRVAHCHDDKDKLQFTWHVFRKSSSEQLNLVSGSSKYSLQAEGTLAVKSFQVADSGIYHCGVTIRDHVATGAQVIGNGTVVAVTEISHQIRHAVIWLLFVLLAVYSLIVLTLLILKMTGRDVPILRGKCGKNNDSKNNSTRRRHFRAVLQELYSNRNLHSTAKTRTLRPSADSQFENPHTPTQDDIYQNM